MCNDATVRLYSVLNRYSIRAMPPQPSNVILILFQREGTDLTLVSPEIPDDEDQMVVPVVLPEPLPLAA